MRAERPSRDRSTNFCHSWKEAEESRRTDYGRSSYYCWPRIHHFRMSPRNLRILAAPRKVFFDSMAKAGNKLQPAVEKYLGGFLQSTVVVPCPKVKFFKSRKKSDDCIANITLHCVGYIKQTNTKSSRMRCHLAKLMFVVVSAQCMCTRVT